ncbi:conserved hypothetical protein [Gammaproteobacteria bacterium]
MTILPPMTSLTDAALICLMEPDPDRKLTLTATVAAAWNVGELVLAGGNDVPCPVEVPGRPGRPVLLHPRNLSRRGPGTPRGHAALLHALSHIEFNAINLAWDAVHRFPGLPAEYYGDWIRVAAEEALHFGLLRDRLRCLGYDYGDFPAHDGLWATAQASAADPLLRMALVPRLMEAHGLDVTPGISLRLATAGDSESVAILARVLHDEIGHVAAGDRWFRFLCAQRDLSAETVYRTLVIRHLGNKFRGPYNRTARLAAGFTEEELDALENVSDVVIPDPSLATT